VIELKMGEQKKEQNLRVAEESRYTVRKDNDETAGNQYTEG
jgi:hypothetical protein